MYQMCIPANIYFCLKTVLDIFLEVLDVRWGHLLKRHEDGATCSQIFSTMFADKTTHHVAMLERGVYHLVIFVWVWLKAHSFYSLSNGCVSVVPSKR